MLSSRRLVAWFILFLGDTIVVYKMNATLSIYNEYSLKRKKNKNHNMFILLCSQSIQDIQLANDIARLRIYARPIFSEEQFYPSSQSD